jgi:hypothetical protein
MSPPAWVVVVSAREPPRRWLFEDASGRDAVAGRNGRLVIFRLRAGNAGNNNRCAAALMTRLIRKVKTRFPSARILARADSGAQSCHVHAAECRPYRAPLPRTFGFIDVFARVAQRLGAALATAARSPIAPVAA